MVPGGWEGADAKKALTEAEGDFDKAAELLRISGATKVANRAEREASNGLVAAAGKALIQLGAETDFVAKNDEFIALANQIAAAVEAAGADSVEAANQVGLADGRTVAETVAALSAKIGEKIELVNVARFTGETHTYLHRRSPDLPPQVGVLVEFEGTHDEAMIHTVALQIASMRPTYVHQGEIAAETIESEKRIAALLEDEGIIRNRLKIRAAVENAKLFCDVAEKHGGFAKFIWSFVDGEPIKNAWKRIDQVPATSPVSDRISKELKRLGFKFVGSTIIYAHMQATGMVNDHLTSCFRYDQV